MPYFLGCPNHIFAISFSDLRGAPHPIVLLRVCDAFTQIMPLVPSSSILFFGGFIGEIEDKAVYCRDSVA